MITDGEENSSRVSISQIVKTQRQGETQVFAFNIVSPARGARGVGPSRGTGVSDPTSAGIDGLAAMPGNSADVLPKLIGDSGGFSYRVAAGSDAAALARAFVDDLRFQYTLGYTPLKAFDGKYRRVKIEVNKRGFRVRHRGGYLALPLTQ